MADPDPALARALATRHYSETQRAKASGRYAEFVSPDTIISNACDTVLQQKNFVAATLTRRNSVVRPFHDHHAGDNAGPSDAELQQWEAEANRDSGAVARSITDEDEELSLGSGSSSEEEEEEEADDDGIAHVLHAAASSHKLEGVQLSGISKTDAALMQLRSMREPKSATSPKAAAPSQYAAHSRPAKAAPAAKSAVLDRFRRLNIHDQEGEEGEQELVPTSPKELGRRGRQSVGSPAPPAGGAKDAAFRRSSLEAVRDSLKVFLPSEMRLGIPAPALGMGMGSPAAPRAGSDEADKVDLWLLGTAQREDLFAEFGGAGVAPGGHVGLDGFAHSHTGIEGPRQGVRTSLEGLRYSRTGLDSPRGAGGLRAAARSGLDSPLFRGGGGGGSGSQEGTPRTSARQARFATGTDLAQLQLPSDGGSQILSPAFGGSRCDTPGSTYSTAPDTSPAGPGGRPPLRSRTSTCSYVGQHSPAPPGPEASQAGSSGRQGRLSTGRDGSIRGGSLTFGSDGPHEPGTLEGWERDMRAASRGRAGTQLAGVRDDALRVGARSVSCTAQVLGSSPKWNGMLPEIKPPVAGRRMSLRNSSMEDATQQGAGPAPASPLQPGSPGPVPPGGKSSHGLMSKIKGWVKGRE